MAENFLQPGPVEKKTPEEVGDEYFDELVARSFFQPRTTQFGEKIFVMHDLVHDLAMIFAKEFCSRAEEHEKAVEIGTRTRHLSHLAKEDYPISKLLEGIDSSALFELSLTEIVTLPESLGSLYNLQTLKLSSCYSLKMLPGSMQDLVNLRHLDISYTPLNEMPMGMSKLKSLQFLSNYVVGKHEGNKMRELGALANLQKSICISHLENVVNSNEASEARMCDKDGIDVLKLCWSRTEDENMVDFQIEKDILDKLRPHSNLKELEILGYRGTKFPDWLGHFSYHNITKVTLGILFDLGFRNCYMLPSLGQLPSLKHLSISSFLRLEIVGAEFYRDDESFLETPFPMLETLSFESMPCWKEWCSLEWNAFP
ncbi:hypothetical protein PIB30_002010 [Stylosanthes scabra]|uniref:Uncharacterized protein n=1 Tax=Stylosanthes scabra TaxID=79078 RepID=A0ABU6Q2M6_9FABA|nr:hypothetical protein [Stylosanthes scabra]